MPQLVNNLTVTDQDMLEGPISGNGKYHAYRSAEISTNNNKALDATLQVHSFLPNRQNLGRSLCMMVLERKDDAGNWHPFHGMYHPLQAVSYDATENGGIIPDQQLSYGPAIVNFDGAVSFDSSDGVNIIAQDHRKQGVLPDKIRFCVLIHEKVFDIPASKFASITFSIDYELRAE